MTRLTAFVNDRIAPALTALSDNTYMSAIRAGMVSVVPLTIIGGLFMVVSYLPVPGWEAIVAPWLPLLQIPVTATFGVLGLVVCLAIAHDLGLPAQLGRDLRRRLHAEDAERPTLGKRHVRLREEQQLAFDEESAQGGARSGRGCNGAGVAEEG